MMNHGVIRQAVKGTQLRVCGKAPGWLYVELSSGEFGWVMKAYTAPVGSEPKG